MSPSPNDLGSPGFRLSGGPAGLEGSANGLGMIVRMAGLLVGPHIYRPSAALQAVFSISIADEFGFRIYISALWTVRSSQYKALN
jgi:hypothetical protein